VSNAPINADAFNAIEKAGWGPATAAYSGGFGALTAQAVGPLLDALKAGPGIRLLDVASGPGWVAAAAADRGATVVGVDTSTEMLAEARGHNPALEFREGSAEELPFGPNEFDAVAMNFGLLHFGRPEQALREIYRVLRPNGRVGLTVWAAPDKAVGFEIILEAIRTHGQIDVGIPTGPPFFRFSDEGECERVLRDVGFVEPQVAEIPLLWHLPSAYRFFDAMYQGTVRTAALLQKQTPEALTAIKAAAIEDAKVYSTPLGGVEIPMPAVLASASKP